MSPYRISAVLFLVCLMGASGCASAAKQRAALSVEGGSLLNTGSQESVHDAVSALRAVTGAVSDKPMTDEELRRAAKRMKDDPQAKSAVEAISSSFDRRGVQIKYSPVTGKRYSADMEVEPETGARLLILE